MTKILGISGSLRKNSYNAALLRLAVELAPADCELEVASIRGVPLYDADIEAADGSPPAVRELKERLVGAAGLFLVTPEYNFSLPGVLKNCIDWMSRPAADIPRVFGGRPVALCGASGGRGGTRYAQMAWLPVFRALGMVPWFGGQLHITESAKVFDATGRVADEKTREQVRSFVAGFARFVSEVRSGA
jgi:chromate reductase, NAD(P)H dehydrogenase (quinone)